MKVTGDAQQACQVAANHRADQANNNVTNSPHAAAAHNSACKKTRDETDNQPPKKTINCEIYPWN